MRYSTARRLTAAGFFGLLIAGRYTAVPGARGSMTSIRWFDALLLADPLAAVENLIASRSFSFEVLGGAGLLVLLAAMVLGRAFCGWLCPLGLLLDLNDALRRKINVRRHAKKQPTRKDHPGPRALKYYLLAFILMLAFTSSMPVFQAVSPINLVAWLAVFATDVSTMTLTISALPLLIILLAEQFSRRLWCRSLCPLGAFYSLIGHFANWRIRIDPTTAGKVPCGKCTRSCSMGIAVMEDYTMVGKNTITDPECTRCGDCIDACPREVLTTGVEFDV